MTQAYETPHDIIAEAMEKHLSDRVRCVRHSGDIHTIELSRAINESIRQGLKPLWEGIRGEHAEVAVNSKFIRITGVEAGSLLDHSLRAFGEKCAPEQHRGAC